MVKDQTVRHYAADTLCEALFAQPGPTRLWTLLQALPEAVSCGAELAAELMSEDPRFAPCASRWQLAHRPTVASRPLGGALDAILQAYGRPMPRSLLVAELCLSRPGDPPQFNELLDRLLLSGRDVGSFEDLIYLTKWLANTSVADVQSQLFINGLSQDEVFKTLHPKLLTAAHKGRHVLDTAEAVLKTAKVPVPNRGLGMVLKHHHGDRFSAAETLAEMAFDERFLPLSGPAWVLASQETSILRSLSRTGGSADEAAPPEADVAAVLQGTTPAKFKLDDDTGRAVAELAASARTPLSVDELLNDLLDLRPRQKHYAPAAHALEQALSSDMSLLRVSTGRYLPRVSLPPWVKSVPEALVPETVPLGPREQTLDVLLPLEELAPGLAAHVQDPHYEDQGETEIVLGQQSVDETRMPVACHHFHCGTLKLRQMDQRLFDQPGPISVVTFVTPEGQRIPIWVNLETRLLYGFLTWFHATLPPCGALLTIQRDPDDRDLYHLLYEDETDPGTYIGRERLQQLQGMRERLRRRRPFVVTVCSSLLHHADKGLAFDHLWAQVNVIRRTTRLLLASTLTHYGQFVESHGKWKVV